MSFVPEKIDSLWDEIVVPRILEQYKYSSNWQACLKCVVDRIQKVENGVFLLYRYFKVPFRYDEVSSGTLEYVASLVNVIRQDGESDQQLFDRFILRISSNKAGTPDHVIFNAVKKSGDVNLAYMDEAPATFFVYTPNGKQLMQSDVQRYAPAGVLGLPGAAIQFADGTFMGDANGDKFLAVADKPDDVSGKLIIDGLEYRIAEMPDGRIWMCENLQAAQGSAVFYNNDEATYGRNGKNYGRLYNWNDAMAVSSRVEGWHLPTFDEWMELVNSIGGYENAGTLLKAKTSWSSGNGTDDYGFSVYSAGRRRGSFSELGESSYFCTYDDTSSTSTTVPYFYSGKTVGQLTTSKAVYFSVRLVKD